MYYVDMDEQTAVFIIQYASILQDIDENQCREVRGRSFLSSLFFAELRVSKMYIKVVWINKSDFKLTPHSKTITWDIIILYLC